MPKRSMWWLGATRSAPWCAEKIDHTAGDFQIDLVKMPGGVGLGSTFAQVHRDQGPEMIYPAPNGLVGDHDAAFRQQVFDVTEAQCEPEIEPDRLLDDLWRKAVAAIADFLSRGYRTASGTASPKRRDKAARSDRARKSVSSLMNSSPPSAIPGAFRHPDARLRRATASMRGRPQPDRC